MMMSIMIVLAGIGGLINIVEQTIKFIMFAENTFRENQVNENVSRSLELLKKT